MARGIPRSTVRGLGGGGSRLSTTTKGASTMGGVRKNTVTKTGSVGGGRGKTQNATTKNSPNPRI